MLGLLAHAAHLGLVVLGLVGVAALLLPAVRGRVEQRQLAAHDRRVEALRATVAAGGLGTVLGDRNSPAQARAPMPTPEAPAWRAFAAISSAAAGIAHLAVFPHHLAEGLLLGVFFAGVALGQCLWARQLLHEVTRERLVVGIVGSIGLIALWAWTRTAGLPFGLTEGREPVGGWDLACVTWQVCVIVACLRGWPRMGERRRLRLGRLPVAALAWAGLSGLALLSLSVTATVS